MNDPIPFYLKILGAGVLLAVVWLAITDLRRGKKFRFDLSNDKQHAVLTPRGAWIGFGWGALPIVVVLWIGVFQHHPVLAVLALFLLVLKIAVLVRLLRVSKVAGGSKVETEVP